MTLLPWKEEALNSSHTPHRNNTASCAGQGIHSVPNKLTAKCNRFGKRRMIQQPKYTPNIWLLL